MHTPRLGEGPKILGEREIMKEKVTEEGSLVMKIQKYAGACQSVLLHMGWFRGPREREVQICLAKGTSFSRKTQFLNKSAQRVN